MSTLHLTGTLANGTDAGIAEAAICVVLIAGATALALDPLRGRRTALATIGFAILGFIVGLSSTVRSGNDAFGIAYHATVLPLLLITLAALIRRPSPQPGRERQTAGTAESAESHT